VVSVRYEVDTSGAVTIELPVTAPTGTVFGFPGPPMGPPGAVLVLTRNGPEWMLPRDERAPDVVPGLVRGRKATQATAHARRLRQVLGPDWWKRAESPPQPIAAAELRARIAARSRSDDWAAPLPLP
jgi:hypothetical protein